MAALLALALKVTTGERLGRWALKGLRACVPRILEALLPQAWRTASPGFAGISCFESFFLP